jgi:alpha-glucosidase
VPVPWRRTGLSLGFGPDDGSAPWLPQPASWADLSVEAQEGRDSSFLERVRAALSARRSSPALLHGDFEWADDVAGDGVLAFRRVLAGAPTVLCAVNMGASVVRLPEGRTVCASTDTDEGSDLRPNVAVWIEVV